MTPFLVPAVLAMGMLQTAPAPQPTREPGNSEGAVAATLEELRKGELFLDAGALEPHLAASFTLVEGGSRVSGSFAFLEPIRRLREQRAEVKELRFDQTLIRVFGASAVATYRYVKTWHEGGTRHREAGWSSDVFELRDDGEWIMVLRHRAR